MTSFKAGKTSFYSVCSQKSRKKSFSERDCERDFKWSSLQRWQCPIFNGTRKSFVMINYEFTHLCPFSKSKFNLCKAKVLSIELDTGTGKVDPARKFKCTTAACELDTNVFLYLINGLFSIVVSLCISFL